MSRRYLQALVAVAAAGALLRFATLDLQSFWYDESVTVGLLRLDLGTMLDRIPQSESTPPLYYLLAWGWAKLFGTGEVGLRSLSALLGSATIPAAYAAAAALASRRTALAVAALAAFNPLLIWYSQEARSYALVLLLTTVSLWLFARALGSGEGRTLCAWAVASALAVASHYFAAFVILPEAAWLVVRAPRRRPALLAAGGALAAVLAALPLALHQRGLDLTAFIAETSLGRRLLQAPKQYLVGFDAPLETVSAAAGLLVASAGALAAFRGLRGSERTRVALAGAIGAVAVATPALLALAGTDYLQARNLIVAWVPLALVPAAGLALSRVGVAGLALLCALGVANVAALLAEPNWRRDDWRGAAAAVGPARVPTAIVVTPESGAVPFLLYRPDARPFQVASIREIVLVSRPDPRSRSLHPPAPPRPPRTVIAGFREVERRERPTYTLVRMRADRDVRLSAFTLKPYRLLPGEQPSYFLQRPRNRAGGG